VTTLRTEAADLCVDTSHVQGYAGETLEHCRREHRCDYPTQRTISHQDTDNRGDPAVH